MNREMTLQRRLAVYGPGLIFFSLLELHLSVKSPLPAPDFLLLFPALAALWTPGYDGFVLGLTAGFIRDFAAGRGYGSGMLAGMILGLLGNRLARDGWKNYLIWGGLLVLGGTIIHDGVMTLFGWLIPLSQGSTVLSIMLKTYFLRLPGQLLANLAGALILSAYLFLAFYVPGSRKAEPDLTATAKEVIDG
jgi:rod shape-determining protein MreD